MVVETVFLVLGADTSLAARGEDRFGIFVVVVGASFSELLPGLLAAEETRLGFMLVLLVFLLLRVVVARLYVLRATGSADNADTSSACRSRKNADTRRVAVAASPVESPALLLM